MAPRPRNRSFYEFPPLEGHREDYGGGYTMFHYRGYPTTCADVVGNMGGDNPFTLNRRFVKEGCRIQSLVWDWDFPADPLVVSPATPVGTLPSSSSQIARIMSQTGPLTPKLYLPVSIFELRDIPGMLRHAGDLLHKIVRPFHGGLSPIREAASSTLAYQFGWAPLIQDIGRMCDFADVVAKRQRTLRDAHTTRGIKRNIKLNDEVFSKEDTINVGYNLYVKSYQSTSAKRWATIRWKVRDQSQIGRMPTFQEAFRTAYGLNRGHIPIEIWKALPWSWAIDWFADISNVLAANYNMIYYKPSTINVMTFYATDWTLYPRYGGSNSSFFTGGSSRHERKLRVQYPPNSSISLRLPFLDSFKLSIIGSMTALKLSR